MFQPQRVLISRHGGTEELRKVPGIVTTIPHVGESLQLYLESGKWMRTSPVTKVEDDGAELVVDTKNSQYRLQRAA